MQSPGGPKKSPLGLILGLGGGLVALVVLVVIVVVAVGHLHRGKLPLEANKLPSETREIDTRLLPASREKNDRIKKMYLASEMSGAFCSGRHDPARRLENFWSAKSAKEFFDPANLDQVRGSLECGAEFAKVLDDDHASYLSFDGDPANEKPTTTTGSGSGSGSNEPPRRHVVIGHFKMKALPTSEGFTSASFGSLAGFCQTTVPAYAATLLPTPTGTAATTTTPPTPTTKSCEDKSHAAFNVGDSWFFGDKVALDELSKTITLPKATLGTRVAAIEDAFNETSNLPQVSLVAEPKSSKEYLLYPCEFAATELGIHYSSATKDKDKEEASGDIKSRDDFLQACFPAKNDAKTIEEIDAKLRAIAFEIDPDYAESGSIAGSVILVTRDAEAAKDAEREVNEIVNDWKAVVEQNAPKLIKAGKEQASTTRERNFAVVADTYFQALSKMKVTTSGRTVKISFKAVFTKDNQQDLKDDRSATDKRLPVTEVLEAIRDKKPIPEASLAKIVGKSWAAYLVLPPLPPTLPSPKTTLTAAECAAVKGKLQKIAIGDVASGDATKAYFDQKYALCDYKQPEVTENQRKCLLTFATAADYNACMGGDSSDPRMPPEAEFGKLK